METNDVFSKLYVELLTKPNWVKLYNGSLINMNSITSLYIDENDDDLDDDEDGYATVRWLSCTADGKFDELEYDICKIDYDVLVNLLNATSTQVEHINYDKLIEDAQSFRSSII